MAQLTIYLPDALARRLRIEAKKRRKSLSAYVAELAGARPAPADWRAEIGKLYGVCGGELPHVEDLPADEIRGP